MKAAIFRKPHEPLTIEEIDVDEPRGHEVLVRTAATGVCHSDLHFVDGHLDLSAYAPPGLPNPSAVLGHEGAGIVEAVGELVTHVVPGDHIVACLSGFCGTCEQCLSGFPARCQGRINGRAHSETPRLSRDGTPIVQFVNVASYAEEMLLHENSLVKIDAEIPLDRAALVGCGVLTGVGAALNTAKVRPGSTVAVFGCGGVGLSVVQGARIAGALQIIGVDTFASKKDMATTMGATDFVDASASDPVEAIHELTGGQGVDYAFEAVGNPTLARLALESTTVGGTATIVGIMPSDSTIEFPSAALRGEKKIQTCGMGSNRFRFDIPRYLRFYETGQLLLDEMVSKRGSLEDINDAFRAMKAGEVARTVLTFD
jgi:S-(hydroxymethyl)glutathione dehydrogenase/alcohol dehydrogenase